MIADFPKLHEDVDYAHETAAGESLSGRCLTHEIVVQESSRNRMKFLDYDTRLQTASLILLTSSLIVDTTRPPLRNGNQAYHSTIVFLPLPLRESAHDDVLILLGHLFFDIDFEATEEKRSEDFVEARHLSTIVSYYAMDAKTQRLVFLLLSLNFYFPSFFSRDEATLYEGVSVGVSVGPSVGWSVRNQFFFRPTRSD